MTYVDKEKKAYELRLQIESDMFQLLDNGFTLDDVRTFVTGVLDDMEAADEQDEEE